MHSDRNRYLNNAVFEQLSTLVDHGQIIVAKWRHMVT